MSLAWDQIGLGILIGLLAAPWLKAAFVAFCPESIKKKLGIT